MPRERHAVGAEVQARPLRWWQRALPLTGVAVVAVLAVAVLGGSNRQIELSTSRQQQPFVELALLKTPQQVCGARRVDLRYTVVSHLAATEPLMFTVSADPVLKGEQRAVKRGRVELAPGEVRTFNPQVKAPARGAYDVAVTIQGRPEALRLHCSAARGGAR